MKKWIKRLIAPAVIAIGMGVFAATAFSVSNFSCVSIPWSSDANWTAYNCTHNLDGTYEHFVMGASTPNAYQFTFWANGSVGDPYRIMLYDVAHNNLYGPWRETDTAHHTIVFPSSWYGNDVYVLASNNSSANQGAHTYYGYADGPTS